MAGTSPVAVFANPHGRVFEIVTLRHARGWVRVGPPTGEYSWFAGYAWSVIVCAGCATHLGWLFEGAGQPPEFFGLLRAEIVETGGGD